MAARQPSSVRMSGCPGMAAIVLVVVHGEGVQATQCAREHNERVPGVA